MIDDGYYTMKIKQCHRNKQSLKIKVKYTKEVVRYKLNKRKSVSRLSLNKDCKRKIYNLGVKLWSLEEFEIEIRIPKQAIITVKEKHLIHVE